MRTSSVCVLFLAFSCAIISSDAAKKKPEVEAKVTQKVIRHCWLAKAQVQVSGFLGIQSDMHCSHFITCRFSSTLRSMEFHQVSGPILEGQTV